MSSIPVNIRFGPQLIKDLDAMRGSDGRSTVIKRALRDYLHRQKIADMCAWGKKTAQKDTELAEQLMVADAPIPE